MAKELGYFAERDLDVSVEKQAWASTRDNLVNNEIDGAHCLFGMPFSVATGIGGAGSRALRVAMMLNNNGQAIALSKEFAPSGTGDLEKPGPVPWAARSAVGRKGLEPLTSCASCRRSSQLS